MIKIDGNTPFALGALSAIFGEAYDRIPAELPELGEGGMQAGINWVRSAYDYEDRFSALYHLVRSGSAEVLTDTLVELKLRAALAEASKQINEAKLLYPQVFEQDGDHKTAVLLEEARNWLERAIAGTESRLKRREREVAP